MNSPEQTMGVEGFGTGKPRNKRRYSAKGPKKKPSVLDRVRARRRDELEDDKYVENLDDDLDIDDEDEFADPDDDDDAWDFEDDVS